MDPFDVRKAEAVRQYFHQAEEDFAAAEALLGEEPEPADAIRQHARRAAENYLKAFLVWYRIEFPDTGDLDGLLDRVARVDERLARSLRRCNVLNPFVGETDASRVRAEKPAVYAQDAVNLAGEVREETRYALRDYVRYERERMADRSESLVTVFAAGSRVNFEMAKALLQEAGIEHFTAGEEVQDFFALGRLGTGTNPLTGPSRLQVRSKDAEEAKRILAGLVDEDSQETEED